MAIDEVSEAIVLPDPGAARDPQAVAAFMRVVAPLMRTYFRSEVRGMEHVPAGGALVVGNHSGGMLTMDLPVFLTAFVDEFGFERPFHLLSHEGLFMLGPVGRLFRAWGMVEATRENAEQLLRAGGVTMVFPGGEYDAARPFSERNQIDFGGRTGYVRTASEAGVPIIPSVSIGGHETQLFLGRGEQLLKGLGLDKLFRARGIPFSFGFPFGFSAVLPVNLPLPSKIVTSVLAPIDPGDDLTPEGIAAVDAQVRTAMQTELDALAAERRYPVLG
ncbi:MAG: lysophospholipid acyltransferase family protein [Acidimicrobiales bacterium]